MTASTTIPPPVAINLWPDLSPYGLKLQIVRLPTGTIILVVGPDKALKAFKVEPPLFDGESLPDRHRQALHSLGFERHQKGVWINHLLIISTHDFQRKFPLAKMDKKSAKDVTVDMCTAEPGMEARQWIKTTDLFGHRGHAVMGEDALPRLRQPSSV
jgi:hypothetical protein